MRVKSLTCAANVFIPLVKFSALSYRKLRGLKQQLTSYHGKYYCSVYKQYSHVQCTLRTEAEVKSMLQPCTAVTRREVPALHKATGLCIIIHFLLPSSLTFAMAVVCNSSSFSTSFAFGMCSSARRWCTPRSLFCS